MDLKAAEANLAEVEKHHHRVRMATRAYANAQLTGDKDKIAAAKAEMEDAHSAKASSGVSDHHVDVAAQAVLDARSKAA